MKKSVIALGIIALTMTFIALAPASLLRFALPTSELQLIDEEGSIWIGEAVVVHRTRKMGHLQWSFSPRALMSGKLCVQATFNGIDIHLDAEVCRAARAFNALGSGTLSDTLLNRILINYEIDLDTQVQFENVFIQWSPPNRITDISGTLESSETTLKLKLWELPTTLEIPQLKGILKQQGGESWLTVYPIQSENELMRIRLESQTGWVHVMLNQDLLQLANVPSLRRKASNEFALEVSQKLY